MRVSVGMLEMSPNVHRPQLLAHSSQAPHSRITGGSPLSQFEPVPFLFNENNSAKPTKNNQVRVKRDFDLNVFKVATESWAKKRPFA